MNGESYIPDYSIVTSSRSLGKSSDARMGALPGKTAPDGWVATPRDVTFGLDDEWVQVSVYSPCLWSCIDDG